MWRKGVLTNIHKNQQKIRNSLDEKRKKKKKKKRFHNLIIHKVESCVSGSLSVISYYLIVQDINTKFSSKRSRGKIYFYNNIYILEMLGGFTVQ